MRKDKARAVPARHSIWTGSVHDLDFELTRPDEPLLARDVNNGDIHVTETRRDTIQIRLDQFDQIYGLPPKGQSDRHQFLLST